MSTNAEINQQEVKTTTSCKLDGVLMNKSIENTDTFFRRRCISVHFSTFQKGPCLEDGDTIEEIFGVGRTSNTNIGITTVTGLMTEAGVVGIEHYKR